MNILIVYSTLSGSTMTAASVIENTLKEAGHTVFSATADSVSVEMLKEYNAILFGSPSWEDAGLDGQPLPEVSKLLRSFTESDLSDKKVALFGLGDVMYPHFCGAVDVMTEILKSKNVTPFTESLRIDRYYSLPENEDKVKKWAANIGTILRSK
jgi:flavodoxin I